MVDVLQEKLEAIAELCARHGVARLEVFGSALRDDFRPGESDVARSSGSARTRGTPSSMPTSVSSMISALCWARRSICSWSTRCATATWRVRSSVPSRSSMQRDAPAYLRDVIEACDAISTSSRTPPRGVAHVPHVRCIERGNRVR